MAVDDLKIRVPRDLKEWLKARAAESSRTMNGEILALLKATKRAEAKKEAV